jgi:hypothetical protein
VSRKAINDGLIDLGDGDPGLGHQCARWRAASS